jgi:Ribosomal protein S21
MSTLYAATLWLRPVLAAGPRYAFEVEAEALAVGHERTELAGARRSLGVVVERIDADGWSRARWSLPDRTAPAVPAVVAPRAEARHYPALPPPAAPRRGMSNRIRVEVGTSDPVAALERALRDFAPVLMAAKIEARRRVAFVPPSAARKLKSLKAQQRRQRGERKARRRAGRGQGTAE